MSKTGEILVALWQVFVTMTMGASSGAVGLYLCTAILLRLEILSWPALALPDEPFALGIPAVLALSVLVSLLRAAFVPGAYRNRRPGERDRPCRAAFAIGTLAGDILALSMLLYAAGFAVTIGLLVFHGLTGAGTISWSTARMLAYGLLATIAALSLWATLRLILNPIKPGE